MRIGFIKEKHRSDEQGRPAGGETVGTGFTICWQDGPLGRVGDEGRKEPNGAFVEDVIAAAINRIKFYQESEFACDENASALEHLQLAQSYLDERTKRRVADKTEGTHEGN